MRDVLGGGLAIVAMFATLILTGFLLLVAFISLFTESLGVTVLYLVIAAFVFGAGSVISRKIAGK